MRRLIATGAAALAVLAGGLVATAQAADDDGGERFLPPKDSKVVSSKEVSPRIIGGTNTSISSAPWMVQLLFEYNNDGYFYFTCGGTLVAPNKVLTAAHCVTDDNGNALDMVGRGMILANTAKLAGGPNDEGTAVKISRSYFAGSYSAAEIDNDVALLTLAKPLTGTPAQPAAYRDTTRYAPGTTATTYGWGMTGSSPDDLLADTLQRVTQPLRSDAECTENLDTALDYPGAFKPGHMICAGNGGTGDDSTGKATCPGDSGSPMMVNGRIIGVTSWGVATQSELCNFGGTYDVYTKVSTYMPALQPRIEDTNFSRDSKADLWARTSADGKPYTFTSTGSGFASRKAFPGTYSAYNLVVQTDLNRDGYEDLVARGTSTGDVYWLHRSATSSTYVKTKIFGDWKTFRTIVTPGDVTGDGHPDLLGVASTGQLRLYPGLGNGKFSASTAVGTGYQLYNQVRGHGDFTNDGKPDLLVRRGSTGDLLLAKGTGNAAAPFETPVVVRTNWSAYTTIATPGDVTGDSKPDVVVRNAAGTLYLLKGTGKATSEIFATGVKIGSGWTGYHTIA
ncbi:trypsin-like serine protease [Streptomyces sp. NBC_01506]|uniref:trypsin-like serine protease n=1 Tax=Streptomyces sp. NBC_01506 TaxID=2903887 RepID=UPI003864FA63